MYQQMMCDGRCDLTEFYDFDRMSLRYLSAKSTMPFNNRTSIASKLYVTYNPSPWPSLGPKERPGPTVVDIFPQMKVCASFGRASHDVQSWPDCWRMI